MSTPLRAAGATDTGRQRDHNEDRLHVDPDLGLFMVIDGVGGHAAGETAADIALRMMRARLERETGTPADRIREAMTIANNEIHRTATGRPELDGMSCVATVAMIVHERAIIGHVGDSRLYKLHDGEIRKITSDHAPVGEREDRGELSETEAMRHPRRNEIYRDLGSRAHTPTDQEFIDLIEIPFETDGALLLCTDGLTDLVASADLSDIAHRYADDPAAVASRLIDAANRAGGKDNVSVIFVAGERFADVAKRHHRDRAHGSAVGWRYRTGRLLRSAVNGLLMLLVGVIAGLLAARFMSLPRLSSPPSSTPAVAPSRTLVVGATGDADFPTIGAALAAAGRTDTIEVEPGDYVEQVRIPDTMTLISRVRYQARLVPALGNERWVALTVEGTGGEGGGRVSGFTIAGAAGRPLTIGVRTTVASTELDALDVSGAQEAAIAIEGASQVVLRAAHIHDNGGAGVVVRDGATPQLFHNYVTDNGRKGGRARPGLDVDATSRPLLRWNVITGNGAGNVIGLADGDASTIRENIITAPAQSNDRSQPGRGGGRR